MGLNLQGVLYAHTAKNPTGAEAFSKQADNITGPSISLQILHLQEPQGRFERPMVRISPTTVN